MTQATVSATENLFARFRKDQLLTVSVIDDDLSTRDAIVQLLRSAGWEAKAFASAAAFLASNFDAARVVTIVDIHMPSMNGIEMREHLLSSGNAPPTIFITARPSPHTARQVAATGAIAMLTKPVDVNELLRQLDREMLRRFKRRLEN